MDPNCVFCASDGGRKVYGDARCRVVIADEPFAGFCRVIWNASRGGDDRPYTEPTGPI